jgi:ketosteroid isomerase-like protein
MNNRKVIEDVIAAFDANDVAAILNNMTDDVEWEMLGDATMSGKEAIRQMIIEGDQAAVTGEVKCEGPNGTLMDMYYCDIYELTDGKVSRMISYPINKK